MSEIICNTPPLQYLHQIGQLDLVPQLTGQIIVPAVVAAELAEGRRRGVDVPVPEILPWVDVRLPSTEQIVRLVVNLGPGETGLLPLALATGDHGLGREMR